MTPKQDNAITEVTRRAVFDRLALENIGWSGRFEEDAFLSRLYDLSSMHSTDYRFGDAAGDIWQQSRAQSGRLGGRLDFLRSQVQSSADRGLRIRSVSLRNCSPRCTTR